MKNAFIRSCIVLLLAAFGEYVVRPVWAGVFFLSVPSVPTSVVPIWVALPNLLWYGAIGFALVRFAGASLLNAVSALVVLAILMYLVQYPDGIWVAPDAYAYAVGLSPIIALPLGFVAGFLLGKYRRAAPPMAPRGI